MNAQILIRPPRYKPEYIKANHLGPKGVLMAKERDRKTFLLMQDRARVQKGKGNA